MAAARRAMELEFTEEELADLERVSRSRTEPASHVRVADKQELKRRILAQIDRINRNPVVHKWTYKLKGIA